MDGGMEGWSEGGRDGGREGWREGWREGRREGRDGGRDGGREGGMEGGMDRWRDGWIQYMLIQIICTSIFFHIKYLTSLHVILMTKIKLVSNFSSCFGKSSTANWINFKTNKLYHLYVHVHISGNVVQFNLSTLMDDHKPLCTNICLYCTTYRPTEFTHYRYNTYCT